MTMYIQPTNEFHLFRGELNQPLQMYFEYRELISRLGVDENWFTFFGRRGITQETLTLACERHRESFYCSVILVQPVDEEDKLSNDFLPNARGGLMIGFNNACWGKLQLNKMFFQKSLEFQGAILAHELGHIVHCHEKGRTFEILLENDIAADRFASYLGFGSSLKYILQEHYVRRAEQYSPERTNSQWLALDLLSLRIEELELCV